MGGKPGFLFFFFLCDGCSIRLLKTRTVFLCMGEKVGVGQDPLVFFRLRVVISLNSVISFDFVDHLK